MITCGTQVMTCDYPIHFDTYKGCSHACKYCFVKQKYDISNIEPMATVKSLRNWVEGKRNQDTKWCDWDIPLHRGGNSDPFQPCESVHKCSLECLKVLAETKYPFIVSTKNPVMLTQEPYLSLLKECRCVLQVSMGCSKYDKLEQGAPSYEERLEACEKLNGNVTRIIARIRPYFPDCHKEILKELPRMAKAGVYGISIASFISKKKQRGMKKYNSAYMFPTELIAPRFKEIRELCHKVGLRFFCCEPDLDHWSDDLACCGTEGLEDFIPNKYNIPHLAYDDIPPTPTKAMLQPRTHRPFKAIGQSQVWAKKIENKSFAELMLEIGSNQIEWNKHQKEYWNGYLFRE